MVTTPTLANHEICGRFGNQLFLIATALGYARKHNTEAIFPKWDIPKKDTNKTPADIFEVPIESGNTCNPKNSYTEVGFHYNEIPHKEDIAITGFFQSEKYFKHCRPLILFHFAPNADLKNELLDKYEDILENSVALHIRRGDYLNLADHHPTQVANYYEHAISTIEEKGNKVENVLVFSDDILWCKENIKDERCTYVDGELHADFHLMAMTNHNIIANSSFSWWAAWLNKNPNQVVVGPKNWFGPAKAHLNTDDIMPEEWIKI